MNTTESQFYDMVRGILAEATIRNLVRLMHIGFTELEARGITFSLSGPYRAVRGEWPEKATAVAERLLDKGLGNPWVDPPPRVNTSLEATLSPGGTDPD